MTHFVWNFDPEISQVLLGRSLWPLSPRWYGLCFAIGIAIGYMVMKKFYRDAGRSEEELSKGLMLFVFGTVAGARIGHCLFYEPLDYLYQPWRILFFWEGGLASHGGTLGIFLAMILYTRRTQISFLWLADRLALAIPLGVPWIRVGNFFNSEIVGKPTDLPWGIVFARLERGGDIPRHPAQLYEALAYWAIAAALWIYFYAKKQNPEPGRLLGWMLIGIFTARFLLEFVKIEQVNFEVGMPLNMGQILSIPMVLLGVFFIRGGYQAVFGQTPRRHR